MTNYKTAKCTIKEKQSVRLLYDKLKRGTIVKAKSTPPLDSGSPQAHAGRTQQKYIAELMIMAIVIRHFWPI